jgi:hypothetical protein
MVRAEEAVLTEEMMMMNGGMGMGGIAMAGGMATAGGSNNAGNIMMDEAILADGRRRGNLAEEVVGGFELIKDVL